MNAKLTLALAVALLTTTRAAAADDILRLTRPVDCAIGRTCFIQNLVDHESGSEALDFRCGSLTYDGHNGTDFRVADLPTAAGVDVLAAAAGRVQRVRDGVPDASVRERGRASVAGKECGNGVVIRHSDGWVTQYCHLAMHSIRVHGGDEVSAGQPIGVVGLSGLTEYPHLHLTVRHRGKVVDPFAYGFEDSKCGSGVPLWEEEAVPSPDSTQGFVINSGFAGGRITRSDIEAGVLHDFHLRPETPLLVAAVRSGGLLAGDIAKLTLWDPDGTVLARRNPRPLSSNMAEYTVLVGKTRPSGGWPHGLYSARYEIVRGGTTVIKVDFRLAYDGLDQ